MTRITEPARRRGIAQTTGIARPTLVAAAITTFLALSAHGAGETITVNVALDDFMDFGGAQMVADLPGPDGLITLREAVTAANNTPGPQTIAFAIPTSEWSIFFDDRAIIHLDFMCYVSGDETTIDFSTQTLFTGDTNPDGNEVGLQYAGVPSFIPCLWLAGNGCTVKGLDIAFGNNFSQTIWITGNNNHVIGCTTNGLTIRGDYGGGDLNTIGGTGPGEGNTFSEGVGIYSGASDNVVVGNNFRWGLRVNGDTFYGTCDNNRIGGPTDAERNNLAGHGYYAEEGLPSGTQLDVQHAKNTVIENNYVGTTPDGSAKYPGKSGAGGIAIYTGAVDTIIRNNLVSGIEMTGIDHFNGDRFGVAIGVGATATGTVMTGNRIGVAADGTTPIINVLGVLVYSDPNGIPTNTHVGGAAANEGNLIANNETGGLRVLNSATGVRISANSIFDNGGLGIDLLGFGPSGFTANDLGDGDTGGNGLQNFPVLASADATGSDITIAGTFNSLANQAFTIEFFANPTCDPSGYGEGRTYLGAAAVTTDGAGNASFSTTLPASVPAGSVITSTAAQDATGNTSEFSACVGVVEAPGLPGDIDGDGKVDGADLGILLGAWGTNDAAADLNGDGVVDGADLGVMLGAWVA
ncbi:MAG: GC-type dockerin domain-anchored protein [Phycisphaerales bacterium]